jgi:hypothetical protein
LRGAAIRDRAKQWRTLEGTASMTVAYAISRADLVLIPTQGSQLDAAEAAKAVKLTIVLARLAQTGSFSDRTLGSGDRDHRC